MQFEQWIIYSANLWKTLSRIPLPSNENQFLGAQSGYDKERTIFVDITWWFQIIVHNFVAPRGLHNSMNLWYISYRATPDEWVIVESYGKMWKISPLSSDDVQHATGEELREVINSFRKKKKMKRLGQYWNYAQLWMCLVVKVQSIQQYSQFNIT